MVVIMKRVMTPPFSKKDVEAVAGGHGFCLWLTRHGWEITVHDSKLVSSPPPPWMGRGFFEELLQYPHRRRGGCVEIIIGPRELTKWLPWAGDVTAALLRNNNKELVDWYIDKRNNLHLIIR